MPLVFLNPWALGALAAVPVLWWLMRVTPPRPRTVKFPGFFLLKELQAKASTAARTPWWLMVLRSVIVTLIVFALAEPVRQVGAGVPGRGAVLVVVDNGWSAAANWEKRAGKIREMLPGIGRQNRAVVFLPTAPPDEPAGPMDAGEALRWIARLEPRPWAADHAKAREEAQKIPAGHSLFFSDGTAQADTAKLLEALPGGLTVVHDAKVNAPYVLKKNPGTLSFTLERLRAEASDRHMSLVAFGAESAAADELKFTFPAGKREVKIDWDMPADMRSRIERIALPEPKMASAVALTDSRWRRRPVGIVSDPASRESRSFLSEVYYLRRALEDGGQVAVDGAEALMKRPLSAIIWPDSAALSATEHALLAEWVEKGGFLIRFAGPGLAANPDDDLLPVALRHGQRSLEGAMTWEKPVKLGAVPEESPLFGLDVPKDVTVTRQVLAEPVPESFERTWLQLEDGTPLATGASRGKGVVALIHTTAGPGWSDFCYSGLYVEALQRMVSLSAGIGDYKAESVLPPLMLMDGFGRLRAPEEKGRERPVDPRAGFTPSPETPPGLYGDRREFQVFNLGDHLPPMAALEKIPARAEEQGYDLSGEKALKPDLLRLALALLLLDTLATLMLRGVFAMRRAEA